MNYEFEDFFAEIEFYGLYEDLYTYTTLSVEQSYEEYWKEKNGEM